MASGSDNPLSGVSHGQIITLGLVLVITFAFMGFVFGINEKPVVTQVPHVAPDVADAGAADVPEAVDYAKMGDVPMGPNAQWRSHLSTIARPSFDPNAPLPQDPASIERALQTRMQRRAFDGAPPVVPHPIDEMTTSACMACHGEGIRVGEKIASKMSHRMYASCTQCHVEARQSSMGMHGALGESFAQSTFEGIEPQREGYRAYPGAPPTVPHSTWMRENCLACHGASGDAPLRTSHPWRVSCLQCHAPDADLDQYDWTGLLQQSSATDTILPGAAAATATPDGKETN